ncbi:hypothetical protein R1flu_019953 [Riccia fluitans]|uniref:Uncharacterized protein n=1 Tax=Riccia fluitans TaxID=41844 RepID=A0ABD1ZK43_9MARC
MHGETCDEKAQWGLFARRANRMPLRIQRLRLAYLANLAYGRYADESDANPLVAAECAAGTNQVYTSPLAQLWELVPSHQKGQPNWDC